MDTSLRAPWRAALRIAVLGTVVAAALVLFTLLFGARSASAAETTNPAQPVPAGTAAAPLHDLVSGVAHGVGNLLGEVTTPVTTAIIPQRPAPAAPAAATPQAPIPASAAPAAAPAPAPASSTTAAPANAAPAPAAAPSTAPAAPAATSASAPAAPASASAAPASAATAPAAASNTTPNTAPIATGTPAGGTGVADAPRASRPVTDALADTLRPVTGAVQELTGGTPLASTVGALDQVVGSLPVLGSVLGDDTLTTVTAPVTALGDGVLGDVGTVVGRVPDTVADPIGSVPSVPSTPSGPAARPGGSVHPTETATAPQAVASATALRATAPATRSVVAAASTTRVGSTFHAVVVRDASAADGSTITVGGRGGLLVPGGPGTPTDPSGFGAASGSLAGATGSAPGAAAVPVVSGMFPEHGSIRSVTRQDALPASVPGNHDVAPD